MRLFAGLILISAQTAAFERPRRCITTLRGGATSRYYGSSYRNSYPVVRSSPLPTQEPEMSDAERVYVQQQFSQQIVRKRFLKRVYAILAVQLAATAGLALTIRATPMLLQLLVRGQWLLLLVSIGCLYWLALSERARKTAPGNGLLLAAFTLAQGSLVGAMTARLPAELVVRAAGATALATGSLSVYALQTKRDFTALGGMLSAGVLSLFGLMLAQFLFGGSWFHLARVYFGVLLFSAYIVYNTQLMMGGGKSRQLRPDEHIMAAVMLYTDIINLFIYMLQSMSNDR